MRTGGRTTTADQKTYQMVKAVVNSSIETKHHSATFNAVPLSVTGPFVYGSTDLTQGTGDGQRIGSQYTVTSFKYDFFFSAPGLVPDQFNNIRLIIYIPRNTNQLITNLNFNEQADWDQHYILRDIFIPLAGPAGTGTVRRQGWIKFPKGKKVSFDGPLGADCVKNRICMYATSDSTVAGHPVMNGYTRLFFKDA